MVGVMERRGVTVLNGIVNNVLIWSDETDDQLADDGFDHYEETTDFEIQPGIGWTWNQSNGYRPPSPYASWTWDGVAWVAPQPEPSEGGPHEWNEITQTWDEIPQAEPSP